MRGALEGGSGRWHKFSHASSGVEKLVSYRSAELKSQLHEAGIPLLVRRRPS